jgi:hypothetical protein
VVFACFHSVIPLVSAGPEINKPLKTRTKRFECTDEVLAIAAA